MSKVFKWAAGSAVIVAAAFGGWSLMKPEPQSSFITEVVKRGDIRQTVSATGEISPSNLVSVGAEASGQIKKLYVKLGQQVKKGDLIAEIDSTNQINTLNTEKSKLETYQAKLVSAEIALSSGEKKYKRELALWKEQATSKENLESAQDSLAAAKANVAELKASIKQSKSRLIQPNPNWATRGLPPPWTAPWSPFLLKKANPSMRRNLRRPLSSWQIWKPC